MTFHSVSDTHFATYNARMALGMADKLFFAERTNADVYVDFGCADGTLLSLLQELKPAAHMVGYDLSSQAIEHAQQAVNGTFFSDWKALEAYLAQFEGKTIALIASSVIHEVYAYGGQSAGDTFWERLNKGPFTHFIMRDMSISDADVEQEDLDLAAEVYAKADPQLISEFEDEWGSIVNRQNLAHFLLKYRYVDNWARELEENYLPITREQVLAQTQEAFQVEMLSHEVLPFLADRLADDFGISFPCTTHFKLILRRKKS